MEITLIVTDIDCPDAVKDMTDYVAALQREVERKKDQGFPGAWMQYGSQGGVYVKEVRLSA